jgi:hypothetical protein
VIFAHLYIYYLLIKIKRGLFLLNMGRGRRGRGGEGGEGEGGEGRGIIIPRIIIVSRAF